jgi:hypothetical protein
VNHLSKAEPHILVSHISSLQVNQYERTVTSLNIDVEYRDAELSKLRDKANSLTVTVSNLKKELEVKGREVLGVRREANALLQ